MVNKDGKPVSKMRFSDIDPNYLSRQLVPVKKSGDKNYRYANFTTGQIYKFRSLRIKADGRTQTIRHFVENKGWVITDKVGDILLDSAHEYITAVPPADSGLFLVKDSGKYGVVNSSGKIVVPKVYRYISAEETFKGNNPFGYSYLHAIRDYESAEGKRNSASTIYSLGGELILPEVKHVKVLSNSRAIIVDKGQNSLYNLIAGETLYQSSEIETDYSTVSKSYILVKKNSRYGVIDLNGKLIVPVVHKKRISFTNKGFFQVMGSNKVINVDGDVVNKVSDDSWSKFEKNFYVVNSRKSTSVYNYMHELLLDLEGQYFIRECGNQFLDASKGGVNDFNLYEKRNGSYELTKAYKAGRVLMD